VCRKLRADATTRGIGVLMVTALDQPNDIERAIDAGTDDFQTKPINKTELLLRVRALLEAKAATTDVDRGLAYFRRVLQGV
jgi:DNA-binding response OmpR family regulator